MKRTIVRVSLFSAIKYARNFIMAMLVIDFVQRVFYRYPLSGLYILLINAILPFVISLTLQNRGKEAKEKELLNLQKAYGYDRREYYAQLITMILTVVLLWAWYRGTSVVKGMPWQLKEGPVLMLMIYGGILVARFVHNIRESNERLVTNRL